MGLHSNPVDKFLLLLNDGVVRIASYLLYLGHLDPLLGLFYRLLRKAKHLFERLDIKI